MRVLVITNMYPPHHYGGYELNCQEFVTSLRAAGHQALVLTSDIRVPGVEVSDEEPVRRELQLYWRDHVVLDPSLLDSYRIEQRNESKVRTAISDFSPDVVSVWHMGALSMGLLPEVAAHDVPMVHVINDDWLVYGVSMDRWARWWRSVPWAAGAFERVLSVRCRPADLGALGSFLFISHTTKAAAERTGARFPDAVVGYCGVNTADFPIVPRPPHPWTWRLLHVGRIDARKGIDTAIRALACLPEAATLEVLGWGDDQYLQELHSLASQLDLAGRVRFGAATRRQLRASYEAADALVFPPRWAEPFGLVPLEAMACSTPVVATGTGGSGEFLIDRVNCSLVDIDDHEAIARAVQELAEDPSLREQLVDGGRTTATELSLERWLGLLEAWHRSAAAGTTRPEPRRPVREVLGGFDR